MEHLGQLNSIQTNALRIFQFRLKYNISYDLFLLHQITDLLIFTRDPTSLSITSLTLPPTLLREYCTLVDEGLQPCWDWLQTIMDCTESQLRFGLSLSSATDSTHPSHPLHENQKTAGRDRRTREDAVLYRAWESKKRRYFLYFVYWLQ